MKRCVVGVAAVAGLSASCFAQVDGSYKPAYGPALSTQVNGTQFGDSNLGVINWANGSELDAFYCYSTATHLNILLTGNLESNYNKLELFFDNGVSGGQNKLRGDNAPVSFGGLNRMGDDGSGNGLRFDAGFLATHWLSLTGGDIGGGNYGMFVDGADLLPTGGGPGWFVGGNNGQNGGTLTGGDPGAPAVLAAINNSNTLGANGSGGFSSPPESVTTGMELSIPLAWLGVGSANGIRLTAFINGSGHDFASNQFLAPLPAGYGNMGDPRFLDLAAVPGDQFILIPSPGAASFLAIGGLLAARRRRR
ncbi:MAG: hypothetical protein JNM80_11095 [Phycisphaerae bacterium]|nr:hypothetical protein [Phycisphaerae bacterium]